MKGGRDLPKRTPRKMKGTAAGKRLKGRENEKNPEKSPILHI